VIDLSRANLVTLRCKKPEKDNKDEDVNDNK
jgi:hypothetical protein